MTVALDFAIVPTGVANLASVLAGLRRAGAAPRLATGPGDVRSAPAVLLPGVGAFDAGMAALDEGGFADVLRDRVAAGRPTLAICLGLQLLLAASSESEAGRAGLGLVPGRAERFGGGVRVPHLGWNRVECPPGCTVLASGHAYFANSYRLAAPPRGFECAQATHGGEFVAALERGPLVACQFHPELSGAYGRGLLERFVALATEAGR